MQSKSSMDLDYDSRLKGSILPHIGTKKLTMRETYMYYHEIIKKPGKELENLSGFISSDTSLPLFEENLRLTIIDSLHLKNEVVKILLSQNDYQISKVLGFKWFFENLSSEFCIKELFPFISVSIRCKVINRLSKHLKSTEEAQKYFEFIGNTYDPERANYILPRCSPEFILKFLQKTKQMFDHNNEIRVLYNICKRYPDLGVQILSDIFEMKKEDSYALSNYKKILLYLSGNHPDLIVNFIKKYYKYMPSNIFGIKLTKKLSSKLKEALFPDLVKSFLFKERSLFLILNNEEQIMYLSCVVNVGGQNLSFQNWKASNYRISQLLKLIPEERRLKVIETVFKEVCNSNFNNHSECWTSEILELLPTATRIPFLQKLELLLKNSDKAELKENVDECSFNPESPEKLMYLYDSSTAFVKFQDIIRKCPSPARRESVLTFMVKNCSINKDIRTLQQLVEFVAARHRNDDYNVIIGFTNSISNHFPSSEFTSTIFEKIEELTYFFALKRSSNDLYNRWKELHIFYRLENNMEIDLRNFFQSVILKSNYRQSFVRNFTSKYSRAFILDICQETLQWIRDKTVEQPTDSVKNALETLLMSLIKTCKDFNSKNQSNRILIRDIKGLEEIIKRKAKEKLADIGGHEWPMDFWEFVFASRCHGDIFSCNHKPFYLTHIIKKNPQLIVKYVDGVVRILLSFNLRQNKAFLNFFMINASFLGITEKVKQIIRNEFENSDAVHKRKAALELYSHICTTEEFLSLVENYIPKQERVESKRDDFDEIQMSVPGLIKNVKPRWKNLNLISKFYYGDFLKSVLPSFSACCYHTRYDLVIPFLKEQLNATPPGISYKKNIIRLMAELSNQKDRSEFYLKCWDEYKHYSIRTILMFFVSKSFTEHPSQESFRVLERCILECDELTIESIPNSWKIPKEYFSDYVKALWRFSEDKEKAFREVFKNKILWHFNRDNINLVPVEFCEAIMRDLLFNSFSDNGIETFTTLYLGSKPEAVHRRVHFVLDVIKTRKPSPKSLHDFLTILILTSRARPADFVEVFKILLQNWPEYPVGVLFEVRILLNYYYLYYSMLKKAADLDKIPMEFGKELKNYFSNVESLSDLVFIYSKVLANFFEFLGTSNAALVVRELVTGTTTRTVATLAILSLPKETVIWYNMKGEISNENIIKVRKLLNEIFKIVESSNDRIVEIYMRSKYDFVKP